MGDKNLTSDLIDYDKLKLMKKYNLINLLGTEQLAGYISGRQTEQPIFVNKSRRLVSNLNYKKE